MAKGLWPVINVSNVDKSVEFYNGIGLKATIEDMQGMRFGNMPLGDAGIIIWDKNNLGPDQPADAKAWASGDVGKGVLFTVGVPNATKSFEKAKAMRAEIDTPLEAQPWGGSGYNVVDLDGYVFNVTDRFPNMAPPKKAAKRAAAKASPAKAKRAAPKKATKGKRR